jgi:lipoprotein-anchoring transpeptidase ErfK/SrfK
MLNGAWIMGSSLSVALVAGMVTGVYASPGAEPSAPVEQVMASEQVVREPLRVPFPSADRVDTGPVVMPAVPKPQKMTVAVASTVPAGSGTYGVGVLPMIRFDKPVPAAARWAVQQRLVVSVTPAMKQPIVWSWLDAQTLALRPREFWPQKREVTITSTWPTRKPLIIVAPSDWTKKKPVPPGKNIAIRMTNTVDLSFRIGREQVLTINADTYRGIVTRGEKEVLNVPVSLGKGGWETASGIKTLMEFYKVKTLQNLTGPETWSVEAPYSIRLTWSGEFLHSATWNGAIGSAHTSHGCTNLTLSDARWFYENGLRGDPVITRNTGKGYRGAWDGDGAPWNVGWKTWREQSAVAP